MSPRTCVAVGSPVLRPATADEDDVLRALRAERDGASLALAGLDAASLATLLDLQFEAQRAQYRASYPNAIEHLVIVGVDTVGTCWTSLGSHALQLLDITVRPGFRRMGIATAVLRQLMSTAAAVDVPLVLSVWQDNDAARKLYASLGFQPVPDEAVPGYHKLAWSTRQPTGEEPTA
jgi:ribosomal protein S18 acetylase RimI-like enzyme